jgi:hypothetical protein
MDEHDGKAGNARLAHDSRNAGLEVGDDGLRRLGVSKRGGLGG